MNNLASINNTTVLAPIVILIIALITMTIGVIIAAVYFISKYHTYSATDTDYVGKPKANGKRFKTFHAFLIILGIGIVIRLLMTFLVKGFYSSIENEFGMVSWLTTKGFSGFYTNSGFDTTGSSPLLIYIYFITAGLGKLMGVELSSVWMSFFVKLPYLIADIAVAVAIYRIASKYNNKYVALTLCGLFMLCPIFFVSSSMWGTPYTVFAALAFFAFYYLMKRNIPLMTVFVVLLLSLMPEALYVAPIFLAYMIYIFVKAIIEKVKKTVTFDEAMGDTVMKNLIDVPVCLIIGFCALYLIALPAYMFDYGANIFTVFGHLFIEPIEKIRYFSANALNVFCIFGQNYMILSAEFPRIVFASLFMAIVLLITLVVFLSKKNRANLVLIGAYALCTLSTYFIGMTEWAILPSIVLLILAFIIIKDKRLMKIMAMLSVLALTNGLLAMLYSNNFAMTITAALAGDSALTISNQAMFGFVMSIIMSVVTVIIHIYFTVVMLDISMTRHRIQFTEENEGVTLRESLGAWLRGK